MITHLFTHKFATTLCISVLLGHFSTAAESIKRGPYLQLSTDTSVHVVWRTTEIIKPSVRIGSHPNKLSSACSCKQIVVRRNKAQHKSPHALPLFNAPEGTYQYEAKISGLKPDTRYYYAVYDGDNRLTPAETGFTFRTHPKPGTKRDTYIWVVGDSGTGNPSQKQVHQALINHNKKHKLTLDMYLHVGDMAYGSGKDKEFQKKFFEIYQPTLRNTVCWPSMGNHEGLTSRGKSGVGPYYDAYITPTKGEAGGVPTGNESYYSFDFGRTHFVVLNSHDLDRQPTATMAKWLREDLAKTSPTRIDWIIAYWHHPPYTKGSHDSDKEQQLIEMREHIMPILESNGVDLVLTGHSHIYERSMLMDGAYDTPTVAENKILDDGDGDEKGDGAYQKSPGLKPNQGTVQIVTGHGGTGLRRKGYSPVMRRSLVEHGSTLINIKGNELLVTMLNKNGEIKDKFQIHKKKTVKPTRIAEPWKPNAKTNTPKAVDKTKGAKYIIPKKAEWQYHTGSFPSPAWTEPNFDTSAWKTGKAGFGYGDDDDTTELKMKNKFASLYIRRNFDLTNLAEARKLLLSISYDDAFIMYINGKEAFRKGVGKGNGKTAGDISSHEANGNFELFELGSFTELFNTGKNTIAIEGHNHSPNSSDFTIHPSLVLQVK